MRIKQFVSLLFLLFCYTTHFAQSWQNITYQKGALGVGNILEDASGKLYLYCPKGVFFSDNKGDNWSKLGHNMLAEALLKEKSYNSDSKCFLRIWKDTVYLYIESQYGSGVKNAVYNSICYDRSLKKWKPSNGYYPNTVGYGSLVQNANTFAFLSWKYPETRLSYSKDGMKSWQVHLLGTKGTDFFRQPQVLNEKIFFFNKDTVISTTDCVHFKRRKMNVNASAFNLSKVNESIAAYQITSKTTFNGTASSTLYDSLLLYSFDTTSVSWQLSSKSALPENTSEAPVYYRTASGYFYHIKLASGRCDVALERSLDGKSWEQLTIRDGYGNNTNNITPVIQEVAGKAYNFMYRTILQHLPEVNGTVFQPTSPEDFGYQAIAFGQDFYVTPHYVGNHLNTFYCPNSFLHGLVRWDGDAWQKVERKQRNATGSYAFYTQHHTVLQSFYDPYPYFVSPDEGLSWDTLQHPRRKKARLRITEFDHVFFATPIYGAIDTVFVSADKGKNWVGKKTPSYSFTSTGLKVSFLGYYGKTLCLHRTSGVEKKILISDDKGTTWTDVTYNLPQDKELMADGDLGIANLPVSRSLIVELRGNEKFYTYQLNEKGKFWMLVDSASHYLNRGIQMDTLLRFTNLGNDLPPDLNSATVQLSYDTQNWFDLNPYLYKLLKGDTLLDMSSLFLNKKGIYAPTNYGLFYLPYPPAPITGLDQTKEDGSQMLQLFPNPAGSAVHLANQPSDVSVEVTDLQGSVQLKQAVWKKGEPLEVSVLKEGLYFIKIGGNKREVMKLWKTAP